MFVDGVGRDTGGHRPHAGESGDDVPPLEDLYRMALGHLLRVFPRFDQRRDLDKVGGDDGELRHICSP